MDPLKVGRVLRVIRHRTGLTQLEVAVRAGVSQTRVSQVELGRLDRVSRAALSAIARVLDADLDYVIRWRGGELDRLLDEAHASLVGRLMDTLVDLGWEVQPEVSFSIYGERGSIDVLAWHPEARVVLVIEVKTELTSVEETLRRHDQKARLARRIAEERFGWSPRAVSRLLVLPDESTARRRVNRHAAVLDRAYPLRGWAVRRWLSRPDSSSASGLLHLAAGRHDRSLRVRTRRSIRRRRPA